MKKIFGFCLVFMLFATAVFAYDVTYFGNFTDYEFSTLENQANMRQAMDNEINQINWRIDYLRFISRANRTSEINNVVDGFIREALPARPSIGACYRCKYFVTASTTSESGYMVIYRWNGSSWQTITYSFRWYKA